MSGRYSRNKGHTYERNIVGVFQKLGFKNAASSRSESKKRDDQKVDLVGVSPFNIQCKATETAPNMHTLLDSMPDEDGRHNVVYHKRSHKGSTVTMRAADFEEVVSLLVEHDIVNPVQESRL